MKKTLYWFILAFAFSVPLLSTSSAKVLIAVLVISLFVRAPGVTISSFFRKTWDVWLYLIVLGLGLFYSMDVGTGWKTLETNFSFLALAVIFSRSVDFKEVKAKDIFYAFASGVFVACAICLINAFIRFSETGDIEVFFYYQLADIIGYHPTYLAYYLIFVITFGLYLLYYEEVNIPKMGMILLLIFFFIFLILTGGSTAYISLFLIFSFFILKYILEQRTGNARLVMGVIFIMLIALFLMNTFEYWSGQLVLKNDYWERSNLWAAAIGANQNPLLGVGTGDYKIVLNEYYRNHGLSSFADESFNSHNQFLQVYLANGLIGLGALLLLLVRPLYSAIMSQRPLGILVFFPFIVYGMNEVFLGRYQGVVFFALLHQIFAAQYGDTRPVNLLKGD